MGVAKKIGVPYFGGVLYNKESYDLGYYIRVPYNSETPTLQGDIWDSFRLGTPRRLGV